MDLSFKGAAVRLDDLALPALGERIGVGEDEIHAFLDVETLGHGFDGKGRPVILFEPHVFYRNLSGTARARAMARGLAYPKWGEKPYPKDSYPRLTAACAIDETAALKSTSWGLGQVLGENFEAAGFLTVQAMVEAMMEDEELQLLAAVNFIRHNGLDAALRAHDWVGFARGYNGAGYKKNNYDVKLADAFRKWSRIADTPWPAAASPQAPGPMPPPVSLPPLVSPSSMSPPPVPSPVRPSAGMTGLVGGLLAIILNLFGRN